MTDTKSKKIRRRDEARYYSSKEVLTAWVYRLLRENVELEELPLDISELERRLRTSRPERLVGSFKERGPLIGSYGGICRDRNSEDFRFSFKNYMDLGKDYGRERQPLQEYNSKFSSIKAIFIVKKKQ